MPQHQFCFRIQKAARLSQIDLLISALKQSYLQVFFQCFNLKTNGRLAHIQLAGSLGKALQFSYP